MSKCLEALNRIRKVNYYEDDEEIIEDCFGIEKDLSTIEKELQDYEETKQDLEQVMKDYQDLGNACYKKLKALEIIKEKANIVLLDELNDDEPYWIDIGCSRKLTKEEYELLKEVLL